jgi:hypothetical protein
MVFVRGLSEDNVITLFDSTDRRFMDLPITSAFIAQRVSDSKRGECEAEGEAEGECPGGADVHCEKILVYNYILFMDTKRI